MTFALPSSRFRRTIRLLSVLRLSLGLISMVPAIATSNRSWSTYATPTYFERISIAQGLSQSTVYATLQDRRGFLWFATESGLNRYDGHQFLVFRHEENVAGSISGNAITSLVEDRQGRLWVASSDGGVDWLEPGSQTFRHLPLGRNSNQGTPQSEEVNLLTEDREGHLWIAASAYGLCFLSASESRAAHPHVQILSNDSKDPASLPSDLVTAIFEDARGDLWVGTEDQGLCRMIRTPSNDRFAFQRFRIAPGNPDSSQPTAVTSINEDDQGVLWIGTPQGLYRLSPDRAIWQRFSHQARNPDGLSTNLIKKVYRDRTGTIWVGTDGGGLLKMRPRSHWADNPSFVQFRKDSRNPHSLSSDAVESIFEDTSGVLWIGSYQQGLNKLILRSRNGSDRERSPVIFHRFDPSDPQSLGGENVNAIQEDRFGSLWIGTDGSGLDRVVANPRAMTRLRFEHHRAGAAGLQDDAILCLYLDHRGTLWGGGFTGGLLRIDQHSSTSQPKFVHFRPDPQQINSSANFVVGIYEDHAHRMWITRMDGGLMRFDPATGRFTQIQATSPVPSTWNPYSTYYSILEDAYGTLWLGGMNGLDRFNPETGQFKCYRPEGRTGTLSHAFINCLHLDRNNTLWVGTNGGGINKCQVAPWDGPEPCMVAFRVKDGLPGEVIKGICEDARNRLWVSLDQTLCSFDLDRGTCHPFIHQPDLQTMEFFRHSAYRSRSGELFFGGNDGFLVFSPEDISPDTHPPSLAFTDFKLFNQSVPIGSTMHGRIILPKSITEIPEITLSHRDYVFSLDFAALHFVAPERNQYAYQMEGLDQHWNYVGNQHSVTYTTLPPGNYVFRIKASNCDGIWNEKALRLKIHVLPPWWKTGWFRISMALIVLGTSAIIVWVRLNSMKRRNLLLQGLVDARTQELVIALNKLEHANDALRMQSLTDPLTGLRNRRYLEVCMPEDIPQVERLQRDAALNTGRMRLNIDVLILILDIDHFKSVNDQYGHHAGDLVLKQMADILRRAARGSDTVARWGGEEFLIIARATARVDAHILPERIRALVEAHPFEIGMSEPIHCTCSLGFAVYPLFPSLLNAYTWEQIVDLADRCLYLAKHNGRNAWVGTIPDPKQFANLNALPKEIQELIETNQLPLISSIKQHIHWSEE